MPISTKCSAPRCRRRFPRRPTRCRPTSRSRRPPACPPTPRSTPSTGRMSRKTATSGSSAGTARWRYDLVGWVDAREGGRKPIDGFRRARAAQPILRLAAMPDFLTIAGTAKSFGAARVLDNVDLGVKRAEFVSLLGPSGCGKTTVRRIVAGLLAPDTGTVRLGGEDITRKPPHHRDVGVVFQNYALFPHLTVAENVAFGLEARRAPREQTRAAVARFLDLV